MMILRIIYKKNIKKEDCRLNLSPQLLSYDT